MVSSQLLQTYLNIRPLLTKVSGLNAVDIGYRHENNELTDLLTVRCHINEKLFHDPAILKYLKTHSIQIIPGDFKLSMATLHTSVASSSRTIRRDPIQPGISVGCFECGTLGMIVRDAYDNTPGFITCYHVISGWQGIAVTQPGPGTDLGDFTTDVVGTLERFIPYELNFDGAFIKFNGSRSYDNNQFGTKVDLRKIGDMVVGDELTKSGRTTDVTKGKVIGKGAFAIDYPFYGTQIINGFIIKSADGKISDEGDSGAIWYDGLGVAKGLHFATQMTSGDALACNLPELFSMLQVKTI
jgi:hypothetical protein